MKDAEPSARRRPRRWRWTKRLLLTALVARLLLWLLLAPLADFGAGFAGLSVAWRDASLSLSGLSLHIDDLVVRVADDDGTADDAPLLTAQELVCDVSMLQLLQGKLHVVDTSVAGARLRVERGPDGQLRLPQAWLAAAPPDDDAAAADDEAGDDTRSFEPPLRVDSLRIHDLQLDYVDGQQLPAAEYRGTLDVELSDVGHPDRDGLLRVRVHAPQLCDELYLNADLTTAPDRAACRLRLVLHGLRTDRLQLPPAVHTALCHAHIVDVDWSAAFDARLPGLLQGSSELALALDGVERGRTELSFGPTTDTTTERATPFALQLHMHDVVESVRLSDGRIAHDDSGNVQLTTRLDIEGLTMRRLQPLLDAAGVTLPARGLDSHLVATATLGERTDLELTSVRVGATDAADPIELTHLRLRGLAADDDGISLRELRADGPELAIRSEADGSIGFAGVRLVPPTTADATTDTPAPAATQPRPDRPPLPRLRIDTIDWRGLAIRWQDGRRADAPTLALRDVQITGADLRLGVDAAPGTLTATGSCGDALQRFTVRAEVRPRSDGLGGGVLIDATGISLPTLQPWLNDAALTGEGTDGSLSMALDVDLGFDADGIVGAAELADVRLRFGATRWLGIRRVTGAGLRLGDRDADAGTWTVQDPFVRVHRGADGVLHAAGFAFAAPAGARAAVPDDAGDAGAAAPASVAERLDAVAERPRRRPRFTPNTDQPLLRHGPLRVDGASLQWSDARRPDRTRAIGLDASFGANDGSGAPLPFRAALRLDRAVERFAITGDLRATPTHTALKGELRASGIVGDELAELLPDGVRCTLERGAFEADFDATLTTAAEQRALRAQFGPLQLRDGDEELLSVQEVLLDAPALTDDSLHVRALRLTGVRSRLTETDDELEALGFALANTPRKPTGEHATAQANGQADAQAGNPAAEPAGTAAGAPAPAPIATVLPQLRLDELAIACEQLTCIDRDLAAGAEPLQLAVHVQLQQPWHGDPSAEQPEPLKLQITGAAQPNIAELGVELELVPFALAPTLDVEFMLRDLDTTRLVAALPSRTAGVRGDATALELHARLHARLDLRRRDAAELPLDRPFAAELQVTELTLVDRATDRTFASLAGLDALARAIDPRRGDLLLRRLEVDAPSLTCVRDGDGLHVAGFVFPPATEPTNAAPTAHAAPTSTSTAEFAVDQLRLLGLAIDYHDRTTTPVTELRLAECDLDLQRFSTRALQEPRQMTFTAAVRGGDVELARRVVRSSVLTGLLGSGLDALTGNTDQHQLERRPLLDQLLVNGRVQLYPTLLGKVDVALDRLELAAFRGLAAAGGVELDDGLYDLRVRTDLRGFDGIDIESEHVFTWLSLSEPPDGPISTYLRLPAPLQTVLFALRNNDDEQRLQLDLHVPADGVRASAIADLAVQTLVELIADAVGSAGGRVAGTLTGLLLGNGNTEVPDTMAQFGFAPGSPLPSRADADELLAALADDDSLSVVLAHTLGAADVERARTLANPPAAVIRRTAERLGARRRELERRRQPLAERLVALYAAGRAHETFDLQNRLLALDTQLGELDAARRSALDQLGDANPRTTRRRTRKAAQALAEARLDAIAAELRARLPELTADRIERRARRGVAVDGVPGAGHVVATLRRRSARTVAKDAPNRARRLADRKASDLETGIGPAPDVPGGVPPPTQQRPPRR